MDVTTIAVTCWGVRRDLTVLTPRELDVLTRMGRGLSNSELAVELSLCEATGRPHVAHIFGKLNLRGRAQAVVLANEADLIRASDPSVGDSAGAP